MSGWFHCMQGGFPLDVASYRLERAAGAPIVQVHVAELPLQPLVGDDARRFLDQIGPVPASYPLAAGRRPARPGALPLLQTESLALALIAEQQSWLLVGAEAVAVLRRCAGWHCQGHETLIFAPEISISDHYGYRAADWPAAQREVARQGRTNICLGSNIR